MVKNTCNTGALLRLHCLHITYRLSLYHLTYVPAVSTTYLFPLYIQWPPISNYLAQRRLAQIVHKCIWRVYKDVLFFFSCTEQLAFWFNEGRVLWAINLTCDHAFFLYTYLIYTHSHWQNVFEVVNCQGIYFYLAYFNYAPANVIIYQWSHLLLIRFPALMQMHLRISYRHWSAHNYAF